MNLSALPKDWLPELERYRLQARRAYRPNMSGGHLMRRRGQSLEFREFTAYTPGDDVRHIDWRASARAGLDGNLLIRQFAAEESMTLVISVDIRESMRLPESLPKLQMACWMAESLARIALADGDRVVFHSLFGRAGEAVSLRGSQAQGKVVPMLHQICREEAVSDTPNLGILERFLPPTSVWLFISDFYFDMNETGRQIVRQLAAARDGLRWVMLAELDSWPWEKSWLGLGARRIEGPGLADSQNRFDIDRMSLERVEANLQKQRLGFRSLFGGQLPDWTHWQWPETTPESPFAFFRTRFEQDLLLRQLFMKAA